MLGLQFSIGEFTHTREKYVQPDTAFHTTDAQTSVGVFNYFRPDKDSVEGGSATRQA